MLVAEALASNRVVIELFIEVASGAGDLDGALVELLDLAELDEVPVHLVAPGALSGVLDTVASRPVAAIVEAPSWTIADLDVDKPVLWLADLSDPGNVGTLVRTAEAAGFGGVVLTGDSVDPTNPKVVRAAAGASLRLPIVATTWDEANAELRAAGHSIDATVVSAAAASNVVDDEPVTQPLDYATIDLSTSAIVLGNEAHGLMPDQVSDADRAVTIPLAGPTESLNVAAAGAILCFASWQQRKPAGHTPRDTSGSPR